MNRTLLRIVVAATALSLFVLLVWVLPILLTRRPNLAGAEAHKAAADARTELLALVVACGALGGLAYNARTFRLNETGQVTERYTRSIEQLGSTSRDVRIGGIYGLQRIASDSPSDAQAILEVLCAYVREHAPLMPSGNSTPTTADVLAAVAVIGRNSGRPAVRTIDLARTDIRGCDLSGSRLSFANFSSADLRGGNFGGADLSHASFAGADLTAATFAQCNLLGANMSRCVLSRAELAGSDMRAVAFLHSAKVDGAVFHGVFLMEGALTDDQMQQIKGRESMRWHPVGEVISGGPKPIIETTYRRGKPVYKFNE